jgi:tetratricopeptide (TPR) repeat protein
MKGDYATAETHLREALAVRERLLGRNHVDVAETLTELGRAVHARGRPDEAEPLLIRALAIDRAAGNDYQARVLNTLGLVKMATGDDAAALAYFTEAIAYRRARFGNNHPDLPTNLLNLARVYLRQKAPREAIPLLEESVAGRRRIFGDRHVSTANARLVLATAYADASDLASAERVLREIERTRDPKDAALERALAAQFAALAERSGKLAAALRPPTSPQD